MHPKLQHYVPQFYLRNFSTKRKKQYFICCFDKTTRKTFTPNIKNIASETHYYDFSDEDGEQKSIESFLSDLETQSKIAFASLERDPSAKTVEENKTALADFIAFQESRTTVFRAEYVNLIGGINRRLNARGSTLPHPTENEVKQFQASFLLHDIPAFAHVLLEMKWVLVVNQTGRPFWVSDNPIVRYNPHKSELIGNLGLLSGGIQLHIPLSPSLGLIICDPHEYAGLRSEATAIPANVDFSNSGQVVYSRQYLFSVDDNFRLAEEMLQRNPEFGDPERSRMIVN